jgi:hypothetical protein
VQTYEKRTILVKIFTDLSDPEKLINIALLHIGEEVFV